MTNNKSFNKKRFADLILRIKGYRTLTKLSEDTGISIAHLSRMVNEKLDSPPSPDTLLKLLNNNESSMVYEDLMIAAGYLQEIVTPTEVGSTLIIPKKEGKSTKADTSNSIGSKINEQVKRYKSLCMSTILFNLTCNGYIWSIPSGSDISSNQVNDFTLKLSNVYIDSWTFDIKHSKQTSKEQDNIELTAFQLIQETWCNLAVKSIDKSSKYSIITDDEYLYNAFTAYPPINLDLTISIILTQPEELRILKEEYLRFSHITDMQEMIKLLLV